MRKKLIATLFLVVSLLAIGCGKDDKDYVAVKVVEPAKSSVAIEVNTTEVAETVDKVEVVEEVAEVIEETIEVTENIAETVEENTEVVEEVASTDKTVINVGYMPNYGSLWSIESAIANNMFGDNVVIELKEFPDGPSIIAELEAGTLDVGYIGQGAHKHVINKGLKIFALSHIANADMIIGNSNTVDILGLVGKNIGYTPETSSQAILEGALASEGFTMDDVNLMTLEDCKTESFEEALKTGVVDAVAVWSPESINILENVDGAIEIADNISIPGMPLSLSSWICTSEFADKEIDKLTLFADGLFKGMSYAAKENQEEVAKLVAKRTGVDEEIAYAQRGDAQWYSAEDIISNIESGSIESYYGIQQDNFIAAGDVEQTPIADYVMLDFMLTVAK